jgi:hypothetical protein
LNWGRRSGKTTVFAYEALITSQAVKNAKITYYAQTFGDARDIAWEIFLDVFGELVIKKNETLLEITVASKAGGKSKINLKGWESVVTSQKGRGTENHLVLVDEVAYCRGFKQYWDTVLEPTLLTTRGRAIFASTPNGFNDFYELCSIAQSKPGWFFSHATSYDNPCNSQEELNKKKEEITEDRFVQEYLADFRKQEGLVYKEFDRKTCLYGDEIKIDSDMKIAGLDFGFVNPAALIEVKRDKRDCFWAKELYYKPGKTDAQIAEITSAYNFNKVYPDPENQAAIKELSDRKVPVYEVVKGKDSIKNGIDKIRELFKQGRLKIHKNSHNLIFEFENYHYPKTKDIGNQDELPVKENDHALDALRYAIMMELQTNSKTYEIQIRQFQTNEYNFKNNNSTK